MRKVLIHVACFALTTFHIALKAMSAEPVASTPANYLAVPIGELHADNVPVKRLMEEVVNKARAAGAEKLGFRGVAIANQDAESMKVSMHLTNVPFGKALGYLADLTYSVLVEGDGLCVLYPITLPESRLVSRTFEPSEHALRTLKLAQAKSPEETRAILESFGVGFAEGAQIIYASAENVLYAKLPAPEIEVLRALLALIDRGVGVTARTDARPK
jgi:hypothetical protein